MPATPGYYYINENNGYYMENGTYYAGHDETIQAIHVLNTIIHVCNFQDYTLLSFVNLNIMKWCVGVE